MSREDVKAKVLKVSAGDRVSVSFIGSNGEYIVTGRAWSDVGRTYLGDKLLHGHGHVSTEVIDVLERIPRLPAEPAVGCRVIDKHSDVWLRTEEGWTLSYNDIAEKWEYVCHFAPLYLAYSEPYVLPKED